MKKRYNRPVCKVIEVDVQDIMAGSPTISYNGYSDTSEEGLAKRNCFLEDDFEDLNEELQY